LRLAGWPSFRRSKLIDLVEKSTLYSTFAACAERFAERPFLRAPVIATREYAAGAIEYSYASARYAVDKLRAGYQAFELVPGDRVALAFDSRLDLYLHMLAINALGASIVPLNMAGSDNELLYVIDHSDARLVTGVDDHLGRLNGLVEKLEEIRVVPAESISSDAEPASPVGELETEVALLYTSGTTGMPKGCMLSNAYFLTMGRAYNELGGLCSIEAGDRLLTPLPPNHMNALSTSFMAMMMCGGCVVQMDRFHPQSWWQTVREERATIIHYLGVMPAILLTLEKRGDEDFSAQIRFGFGAGINPRQQQVFEDRFGFPLIEAWAMTETGGAAMIVANGEPRLPGQRCIGRPKGNMELRVVDESDQDVMRGQEGELLVRSKGSDPRKGFFSGYYKDVTATEKCWRGGWWHTGDIVRQGPDDSLFFVDRRKNVIRRSGENIAAAEVEAALLQQAAVDDCVVTSVPDSIRGDEVFAFIVAVGDTQAPESLARQIFDHSMQTLSYFKAPAYITFVDDLPLTASQKVSRAEVKKLARERIESGHVFDMRAYKMRPRP
jgi:acyl-coenzyme A synthetase/AMP-(fatty) acid ligase